MQQLFHHADSLFRTAANGPAMFECLAGIRKRFKSEGKQIRISNDWSQLVIPYEFPRLYDNQVPAWITSRLKERGRRIEGNAARVLHDMVGNNLGDLSKAFDKLLTYIGDRETITQADVEAVVDLSKTQTVFQLLDSIGEKNCQGSLEILNNLFLNGEKPGGMIFWLTEHLERLIRTKDFLSSSSGSLASVLRVNPYIAAKCQRQAPNFTLEQMEKGLMLLYQTDVDLKSNLMPDKMIMELLVYNLCHL